MMPSRVSSAGVQRAFDAATAVQPIGDGRYRARIDEGWDIGGNANGGYLLALAARAMEDAVGRPPLTVTAHYVARGRCGPCEVSVDVMRAGRRTATAIARLPAWCPAEVRQFIEETGVTLTEWSKVCQLLIRENE